MTDEESFTVHFNDVGNRKLTFDAHMPSITHDHLVDAVCKHSNVPASHLSFDYPAPSLPGLIYAGLRQFGTFTMTPPTLKGDPDEPT